MKKIKFNNNTDPALSPNVLNAMQDNIEEAIDEVSSVVDSILTTELAEHKKRLDELEKEPDWTDLKLASRVTASSGGLGGYRGIQYKKIRNHVYIRGSVSFTWDGSTNVQLTEQLPLELRPKLSHYSFVPLTRI